MPARAPAIAKDEPALVRRAQQGDTSAFGQLVERYQDAVFNLCWRICGQYEDARDLAQATFLRAFQSLAGFEGKSGFYTWLFRIAANLAISHRRRGRRNPVIAVRPRGDGHEPDEWAGQDKHGDAEPGRRMELNETQQQVHSALAELDDEHRLVIVLRDIESMDYQQIAEVLGLPVGTIKSRIHRARMALRSRLKGLIRPAAPPAPRPASEHTS